MGQPPSGSGGGHFIDSDTPLPNPPPQGGRGKIVLFAHSQAIAFLAAALIACASAHAEVQKFLNPCGQQLCASYQLVLTPPDGWAIDKQANRQNKIQVMVPNGTNFATADPLIYVEVFYR